MSGGVRAMHETAIANHCRLACETAQPIFSKRRPDGWHVRLTVNSGYE
jgi:hypothetical protein